jgi:hypothetical protein
VQFDGSAESAGAKTQRVAFRPAPGTLFDDYGQTAAEQLLRQLPLESFDLALLLFVPKIDGKRIHPFVGGKANSAEPGFQRRGQGGFTRGGQTRRR